MCPAVAQSSRRSTPTVRRSADGEAPRCSAPGLEIDDVRLVDLEHPGARRPRQPIGAGIRPEARMTTWRRPAAAASRRKSSKNRVRTATTSISSRAPSLVAMSSSPSRARVKARFPPPDQRLGERIVPGDRPGGRPAPAPQRPVLPWRPRWSPGPRSRPRCGPWAVSPAVASVV